MRLVALNLPYLKWVALIIADSVSRVQGISNSLGMEVSSSYVRIVVGCVSGRVLPWRVPLAGLCPRNVIDLVCFLCFCLVVPVSFRLRSLNIVHRHLISNELGRSDRSHFNFRKVIGGIERVGADATCTKLHALRGSAVNISCIEICSGFVQADVQGSGR